MTGLSAAAIVMNVRMKPLNLSLSALTTRPIKNSKKVVKTPKFENLKDVLSLRLEPEISNKLKEVAHREGLPPTTFARMLIIKGLREKLGAG